MTMQTRLLNVDGMTCNNCVQSVHTVVSQLPGVDTLSVNLEQKLATVTFDDAQVSVEQIAETIEDAGFDATVANS
jgi:copper ion binding protein